VSLGGPSLQILMQTKMTLVHNVVLSDVTRLLVPVPDLRFILLNSNSRIKARLKNSFTSAKQTNHDRVDKHMFTHKSHEISEHKLFKDISEHASD